MTPDPHNKSSVGIFSSYQQIVSGVTLRVTTNEFQETFFHAISCKVFQNLNIFYEMYNCQIDKTFKMTKMNNPIIVKKHNCTNVQIYKCRDVQRDKCRNAVREQFINSWYQWHIGSASVSPYWD